MAGPVDENKFDSRSLGSERVLWVTSPRLVAERWHLPTAQRLANVPVWGMHKASFYWNGAINALAALGVKPEHVSAINSNICVARMVKSGNGIGLVARNLVCPELLSGELVQVPEVPIGADIEFSVVSLKTDSSRIVRSLMRATLRLAESQPSLFNVGFGSENVI